MITIKPALSAFFFFFISTLASAQYISIDESRTPEQLVRDILIDNPCLLASNVTVRSLNQAAGDSYGYFSRGTAPAFPFDEGIILSTGRVQSAVGPNNSILSEGPTSWLGDADLEQALGVGNSINATVLEFDIIPLTNRVSFDYIFASEQYLSNPSANQCNYTDGFVFLIREAGTGDPYYNMAVVPGTTTPVRVNTVRGPGTICPPANEAYFDAFNPTQHPTNFNGQTVVLTASASVTPGVQYHMKLVVADQGNNLYDSAIFLGGGSFRSDKDLGGDRLLANGNPLCDQETLTIDATEPGTGNTYSWFKDNVLETNSPIYTINSPGTYRVEVALGGSGCTIEGQIRAEYTAAFDRSAVTLIQCDEDNDGQSRFNLNAANAAIAAANPATGSPTYYLNITDSTPIANPGDYFSGVGRVYARIANGYGCRAFIPVDLQLSTYSGGTPAYAVCDQAEPTGSDNDGLYEFDLSNDVSPLVLTGLPAGLTVQYFATENDALLISNALPSPFRNTVPFSQTIYARIIDGPDCFGIIAVDLTVRTISAAGFEPVSTVVCDGASVPLTAPSGYSAYQWDHAPGAISQTVSVGSPGVYTVTVTDTFGCTRQKVFTVTLSGVAVIDDIQVKDFLGRRNSIVVTATGPGDYEYSLDGIEYQDEPVFSDLEPGSYTVYVNDINGCGPPAKQTVFVLDYPNYFTPNGDGINDYWRIANLQYYSDEGIQVFDRFGKLVYAYTGYDQGWDGMLDGKPLPSSDYWFVIRLRNGRIIRGHFALVR